MPNLSRLHNKTPTNKKDKVIHHSHNILGAAMLIVMASISTFIGCTSNTQYNPTTNINEINQQIIDKNPLKTLVIAKVNIGPPSRSYLEPFELILDNRIATYLRANGYTILPQREFSQRWENTKLMYGDPIDPATGKVNRKTFIKMVETVRDQILKTHQIDGILFTDLIEHDVIISSDIKHITRFYGVTRSPPLKGPGNSVSTDFDWNQPAAAVSVQITLYNQNLDQLFSGIGGIDLTDAIDTRTGAGWTRRKDILENKKFLDEAIHIALHPLIKMENWPGTKTQSSK